MRKAKRKWAMAHVGPAWLSDFVGFVADGLKIS